MSSKRLKLGPAAKAAFADRLKSVMAQRGLSIADVAQHTREHLPPQF